MFVIPQKGRSVPDPVRGDLLPEKGRNVEKTPTGTVGKLPATSK